MTASAFAGTLFLGVLAHAQGVPEIEQRIDRVFQIVPQNAIDLAVPLSRRALARRAAEMSYMPAEPSAEALQAGQLARQAAAPDLAGPSSVEEAIQEEQGSADSAHADKDARLPHARPDRPVAAAPKPIDLVAGAAIPDRPVGDDPEEQVTAGAQAVPHPKGATTGPAALPTIPPPLPPVPTRSEPVVASAPATTPRAAAPAWSPAEPEPRVDSEPAIEDEPATVATLPSMQDAGDPAIRPEPSVSAPRPAFAPAESPSAPPQPVVPVDEPATVAALPTVEPPMAAPAPAHAGPCLALNKVSDPDGDFSRNAAALSDPGLCVTEEKFNERRRPWTIQTIASGRPGPVWAVVHDDEQESFDTAVHALKTYGGVLITLDTGGNRNQDGIDPNRNFSDAKISCAKFDTPASPRFTETFSRVLDPARPVIALHNNFDGPVPTTGLGHVAMSTVPPSMRQAPSKVPGSPLAGENALILLAALDSELDAQQARMDALSAQGINVVLEPVRQGQGDCSLSNYAVLSGNGNYFNVTVHHGEGEKQRKMIDAIMSSLAGLSASR